MYCIVIKRVGRRIWTISIVYVHERTSNKRKSMGSVRTNFGFKEENVEFVHWEIKKTTCGMCYEWPETWPHYAMPCWSIPFVKFLHFVFHISLTLQPIYYVCIYNMHEWIINLRIISYVIQLINWTSLVTLFFIIDMICL